MQPSWSVGLLPKIIHNYIILYVLESAMRQATLTEVRNHAKQYFDRVEAGEAVRVLRNGKPIADIVLVLADLPSWKRRKAQPLCWMAFRSVA